VGGNTIIFETYSAKKSQTRKFRAHKLSNFLKAGRQKDLGHSVWRIFGADFPTPLFSAHPHR
jgi:hypothetical protein